MEGIKLTIDKKVLDKFLSDFPKVAKATIQKSLLQSALKVQNTAKELSPYKTGNLRGSITHRIEARHAEVGTDVVYGAIQEFGGEIRPKRAKMLRFQVNGKWVMTKLVKIPPFGGRGYLRPALDKNSKTIQKIFAENIGEAIKKT